MTRPLVNVLSSERSQTCLTNIFPAQASLLLQGAEGVVLRFAEGALRSRSDPQPFLR